MAFLKKCTGTVAVTICAVCGENAVVEINGQWYCNKCVGSVGKESKTEN